MDQIQAEPIVNTAIAILTETTPQDATTRMQMSKSLKVMSWSTPVIILWLNAAQITQLSDDPIERDNGRLRQNIADDFAVYIGQSVASALELIDQALVDRFPSRCSIVACRS